LDFEGIALPNFGLKFRPLVPRGVDLGLDDLNFGHWERGLWALLQYTTNRVLIMSDGYYSSKKTDDICEDVCGQVLLFLFLFSFFFFLFALPFAIMYFFFSL
jgi:hypothetical protein